MNDQVWREPDEESADLYPNLVVHDGRVSGSITAGKSRLPLWCFVPLAVHAGFASAEQAYEPGEYGFDATAAATFVSNLLQMRGEFGRLLLVLADAERCERHRGGFVTPWWETKRHRKRVREQLQRCLDCLTD